MPAQIAIDSGQTAAATKTIAALVSALQSTLENISPGGSNEETGKQLNNALITRGIETGWATFDYNGEDVSIQLSELPQWLSNPTGYAARLYSVPDELLVRWLTTFESEALNSVEVQCRHEGCRITKEVPYQSIRQMFAAEVCAKDEYYVCRRHAMRAWERDNKINDTLVAVLLIARRHPGSDRSSLRAKKEDLGFLESLGLIEAKPRSTGRTTSYQYYVTDEGRQYLANRKEQVTFATKILTEL